MSKSYRKDLTGQRFGKLTVLEFVQTEDSNSHWKCICSCGSVTIVTGSHLKSGHTKSCGCIDKARNKKHNKYYTRIYKIWANIKTRCCNINHSTYKDYGGRGITICDEWKDNFQAFYKWAMSNGYDDNLTIDRINNNGNYEPSNCHWVNMKTQCRNRRNNVVVQYKGEKVCLSEAAELSGLNFELLKSRYRRGDRGEHLFRPQQR